MEFERLLFAARATRGVDLLVTHTPRASVVSKMLRRLGPAATRGEVVPHGPRYEGTAHDESSPVDESLLGATPSAVRVEQAWRVLGQPPLVCGHMHRPWRGGVIEVLGYLGVTLRTLWQGRVHGPAGIR